MSLQIQDKIVLRKNSPTREKIRSRALHPNAALGVNRDKFFTSQQYKQNLMNSNQCHQDMIIKVEEAFPSPQPKQRSIRRPTSSVIVNSPVRFPVSPSVEEKEIQTLDDMSITTSSEASLPEVPTRSFHRQFLATSQQEHSRSASPPLLFFDARSAPSSVRRTSQGQSRSSTRERKCASSDRRPTMSRRKSMPVFTDCTRRNLFKERFDYEWEKVLADSEDPFIEKPRVERTPPSPQPPLPLNNIISRGRGSLSLEMNDSVLGLFDSCSSQTGSLQSDDVGLIDELSLERPSQHVPSRTAAIVKALNPTFFGGNERERRPAAPPPSPMLPRCSPKEVSIPPPPPPPLDSVSRRRSPSVPQTPITRVHSFDSMSGMADKVNALYDSYSELRAVVLQLCAKQFDDAEEQACGDDEGEAKLDPEEILSWNSDQVADWVELVNDDKDRESCFAEYASQIREHDFRGADLLNLSRHALVLLGMHKLGHQNLVLRAFRSQLKQECDSSSVDKEKEIARLTSELEETRHVLDQTRELAVQKTNQYHQAVKDHLDFLSLLQSKSAVFVKCIDDRWNCVRQSQNLSSDK